ncbi:MAG: hypothetical protein NVSMB27_41340 [Ktedonobacteraceae bacterium]
MAQDPNQRQVNGTQDPYWSFGMPSNPYGTPPNPYSAAPTLYGPPAPFPPYHYSANQQGFSYGPPLIPATPRSLGEAIDELPRQYIKVIRNPSVEKFAQEMVKADWSITLIHLLGYAVIGGVISVLAGLLNLAMRGTTLSALALSFSVILVFLMIFILVLGAFFVLQGILYLLARAFGGQGTFLAQSYATLLFQVPLAILSGLLDLITPFGGFFMMTVGLFNIAIGSYWIVLQIFTIMAVHRLSGGKATVVLLILLVPVLVLAALWLLH